MAAVFRTLVSSQEPITPQQRKKPSPSTKDKNSERVERSPATPSSGRRLNIFRRRRERKKAADEPTPDDTGLEVMRDLPGLEAASPIRPTNSPQEASLDPPKYFNHPIGTMEARDPQQSNKRDSYTVALHDIAQNAPPLDDKEQKGQKHEADVASPKSFFEDDSSAEGGRSATRWGKKMLKKSLSSLKVSTSNFVARSRGQSGGLGSGSMAPFGGNMGLGFGEIEQERQSPAIGSPTGFRRLAGAQDMAEFSDGMSSRSPSLVKSPSTPSMTPGRLQRGRLGKLPSTSNLGDWFWGRTEGTSPTKRHPGAAEKETAEELRGKTPAYLARVQRRHQTALPAIAERSLGPSPRPRDAAEEDEEPASNSSFFYIDDAEPNAVPAPLRVVKRRERQHLRIRRTDDGKVVRTPSFLREIEDVRAQRRPLQHSTSHPALRSSSLDDAASLVRSTSGPLGAEIQQQRLVAADAPPLPPLPATAPLPSRPLFPRRPSFDRAIQDFFSLSDPHLAPEKALRDRLVGNAFMQQLCRDVFGLEPLRRAGRGEPQHPNHPLKWDTENLMCSQKHNPQDVLSELRDGAIAEGIPTVMRHVEISAPKLKLKPSFTSAAELDRQIIDAAKKCGLCGRYCCHFIELLDYLHSSAASTTIPTSGTFNPITSLSNRNRRPQHADIADERDKIHASAKVMRLKQEHPNGLDPYDTFVICGGCGRSATNRSIAPRARSIARVVMMRFGDAWQGRACRDTGRAARQSTSARLEDKETRRHFAIMAATKRKRSSGQTSDTPLTNGDMPPPPPPKRRQSARSASTAAATVNPDVNDEILDGPTAARASPDADMNRAVVPGEIKEESGPRDESPLSPPADVVEAPKQNGRSRKTAAAKKVKEAESKIADVVDAAEHQTAAPKKGRGKAKGKQKDGEAVATSDLASAKATPKKKASGEETYDPQAEGSDAEAAEEEVKEALSRPPPVHSSYLPLPWKGRLGYACLNTYLRMSNPPVFSSRTCRIQSILEHRHPLQDPSQPEHPTKNKPDRNKPADTKLGQRYVEALCLANVKDIIKMCRWNDRYGIKFFRLSSEMFPFASHSEYGYKLAPFASEALAEAGKVIAALGHRVTTHPGQFTQLGSPRKPVIENAIRDLEYHDELLSLLKLPEQANKDAVMILHMGGVFEGKAETLARFRENYAALPQSIKNRLVLENDDVSWNVHDLLPVCEELNIPFVLDYHHHNILFDSTQIREGTYDIQDLYPRILATWERKGIKPKMHYSEQTPPAITGRQRRKHSPRVMTLPPCPPGMDLMIEAKDKEQACFELMRTFKLPGWDSFNDVVPYTRHDDNKAANTEIAKQSRKSAKKRADEDADEESKVSLIPDDEVGMGGPEGRVYWPPGMEEWLRPKKREVKKKEPAEGEVEKKAAAKRKKDAAEAYAAREAEKALANGGVEKEEGAESDEAATPATKKAKAAMRKKAMAMAMAEKAATASGGGGKQVNGTAAAGKKAAPGGGGRKKKAPVKSVKEEEEESMSEELSDLSSAGEPDDEKIVTPAKKRGGTGRAAKSKRVSYAEDDDDEEMEIA